MKAYITITAISPPDANEPDYINPTAFLQPDAGAAQVVPGKACPWLPALAAAANMRQAMGEALRTGGGYPLDEGLAMLGTLGLDGLIARLQQPGPGREALSTKYIFNYPSCCLMPELIPLELAGGGWALLDSLGPSFRTIDRVACEHAVRPPEKTLAILFQESGDRVFEHIADAVCERLGAELSINVYRGGELANPRRRYDLLQEIFRRHRAVIFLGHSHEDGGAAGGGWRLTEANENPLLMSELKTFFPPPQEAASRPRLLRRPRPMAEVVFANCCSSAMGDFAGIHRPAHSYPNLFLGAGVRFFIATSMKVWWQSPESGSQETQRLLVDFFSRWAAEPDGVIEHLYRAKYPSLQDEQDRGGLQTRPMFETATGWVGAGLALPSPAPAAALYQVYCPGEPSEGPGRREPTGAIVSGLARGNWFGRYELLDDAWASPYARTFQARKQDGSHHLVQILADEWQDDPQIGCALTSAVEHLRKAAPAISFRPAPNSRC